MAEQTKNTGTPQLINAFSKGMLKDTTDVYIPEGVWTNAINAINNAHNGEVGTISNEQSNLECATFPFTVIGIINKLKTEWVVYSTDNSTSEIGIFDESTCSYTKLIRDTCLNFSTYNLITGAVKENYDCSYSAYWQDNRNPDRVLNLDPNKIPYICSIKTVDVNKTWNNYTVARASSANPCGVATNSGGPGVTNTIHSLGEMYGVVTVNYEMYTITDRMDIWFDANPAIDPPTVTTGGPVSGAGSLTFNKFSTTSTCYIRITGPTGTEWDYTVNCPVVTPETPPMPVIDTGIYYTDVDGNILQVLSMDYGQSVTICALEGSIDIDNMADGYSVSAAGTICKEVNQTIPDPDACGEKICTDRLDCDELRLHPLVEQPCVTVRKSKGSGQLNNGSYQAVIAYSENGVKLTDYSMPSNAQTLWDHTGMGGSINITLDNLDQNFEEYELVIIATINQQSVAKKIGYYSINQTNVHLDLYNASLITVDLSLIPIKKVIYEKSEKMFNVSGYLIRSSVTTQPFFNYQPLANQIECNWVSIEYPASYYWDGGHEVGYYRDEVYPFFIRWVYKTGARSASFHIPGREAVTSDLALLPITNPDLIDQTRRKTWQVYDTSTITSMPNYARIDGGIVNLRGNMAYWESTELYPNNHPEIWGDLCNKPIRHHKMPSNETTHIHNTTGDKINILGVEFSNISHPVDTSGNPILDIVGYEILRGSREGNRSILAKGMFNNMIQYDLQNTTSQKGLFQNYPYNDVNDDPFLTGRCLNQAPCSLTNTIVNNLQVQKNIFSFHAPENNLVRPYMGSGGHVKLYTEETGNANIYGIIPYQHPKFKFINEGAFTSSVAYATGLAVLALFGEQATSSTTTGHTTGPSGELDVVTISLPWVSGTGTYLGDTNMITRNPVINYDNTFSTTTQGGVGNIVDTITNSKLVTAANAAFSGAVGLGAAVGLISSVWAAAAAANSVFTQTLASLIDILYGVIKYRDYVVQLNSHAFYNSFTGVVNTNVPSALQPSITRPVVPQGAKYVGSGLQDFNSIQRINNVNRNKFLALQTTTDINFTNTIDSSKSLLDDPSSISKIYTRNVASYYGAIKVDYENQYGQLHAIVQIPVQSCVYNTIGTVNRQHATSQILGGDVYINRYTEKNVYYFYNTWLIDVPNGTEWNYDNYRNGPIPTYWLDSSLYDSSDFNISITWKLLIVPEFNFGTPADLYKLDERGRVNTSSIPAFSLSFYNAWMYLSFNGVRDFFTESELNVAFRDYGEEPWEKFYDSVGNSFTDLDTMFRSDLITRPIYYEYDLSLSASKLYSNFASWGNILPRDYDPAIYTSCFQYYPRRVVYSLQQQEGLKRDNWRNYLQNNYRDFEGKVNVIKTLNAQGAVILFEDIEPTQFVGVDTFQSQGGVKYTIGDAGLFQQNMQSLVNADDAFEYGTCISSKSAVNTPYGLFWVSQKTGKIINFTGSVLDEISKNDMKYWFLENLPSPLLKKFPNYKLYDNVIEGISAQAIFDSQYDLLYFTKKDYKPLIEALQYNEFNNTFYTNINDVVTTYTFDNPAAFEKIEWTISYDPKLKIWLSFHDWHPEWLIPSYNHFLTIKTLVEEEEDVTKIWRHNVRTDSFANYYGDDYPWEVEYPVVTPNTITTLRNFEYTLDAYKYYNNGKDFNHVLDVNFDRAIIYNSEQNSGLLKLNVKPKNNPFALLNYPVVNIDSIDILFSKEENKFRFNQFYDVTNDRGEFTGNTIPMWITQPDGYHKDLNAAYLNYAKSPLEHKKFRHYGNKVILRKTVSADKKMILKFVNNKYLISPR